MSEQVKLSKEQRIKLRNEINKSNLDGFIITDKTKLNYGIYVSKSDEKTVFTKIKDIDESSNIITIRARIHNIRTKGKGIFIILRQETDTIQCTSFISDTISKDMLNFIEKISNESIVDLTGQVVKVNEKIEFTTQQNFEISISNIYCISMANELPLQISDLLNNKVGQDARLNNRIIDLRTKTNNSIFKIQSAVGYYFRKFLHKNNFMEIHTPKIIGSVSEGGADIFGLKYFEKKAYLAQSPQLYKQMAIMSDFERVFEIGPVFRAENSYTNRHLCEFTGLDIEMTFENNYHQVLSLIDKMFIFIFNNINKNYKKELDIISKQYECTPLRYNQNNNLIITFKDAIKLLNEDAKDIGILGETDDIDTTNEKRLGKIIADKYETDFFIIDKFPACLRPFYSMPCDEVYSNSYDIFVRGEEVSSGSERISDIKLLMERARNKKIEISTIQHYLDAFKYGAPKHAGCGIGLERLVMLFLNLDNIRKTSMFPRDPKRITP